MALVLADRVRETTTTTGTGTISLGGPVSGFQGFSTAIGNANTTYYTIADAATGAWEVGLGTYTSSGSTLARTTILSSSNAGAAVNFAAGTKDVFVTQPAERALYLNGAGTGVDAGAAAFTANGVVYASSTSALATGSALTFDGTNLGVGGTATALSTYRGAEFAGTSTTTGGFLRMRSSNSSVNSLDFLDENGRGIFTTTNHPIRLGVNDTEQARLTADGLEIKQSQLIGYSSYAGIGTNGLAVAGNVGVGTASPGYKLDVTGTINSGASSATGYNLVFRTSGITTGRAQTTLINTSGTLTTGVEGSSGGASYSGTAAYSSFVATDGANPFYVITNSAIRATFDSTGNLGLGVTPATVYGESSKFTIDATGKTNGIYINFNGTGADKQIFLTNGGNANCFVGTDNIAMTFGTANTERARISSDGTFRVKGAGTAGSTDAFQVAGTAPADSMVLNSSGNLGVGTTNPIYDLQVGSYGVSADSTLALASTTTGTGTIRFGDGTAGVDANAGQIQYVHTDNAMTFSTLATERARIDSSGNLLVGSTSSSAIANKNIDVNGTGDAAFVLRVGGTSTAYLYSIASQAILGTVGSVPITFNPNGTESVRISSDGTFRVKGAGTAGSTDAFQVAGTAPASAVSITSGGDLLIGITTAQTGIASDPAGTTLFGSTLGAAIFTRTSGSPLYVNNKASSGILVTFYCNNNAVGDISSTGTITAYNTTSDYRLKTVIGPVADAGQRIDALQPVEYTWNSNGERNRGFLAHQFQEVYAGSVTGTKDAVDAEGKPVYQAMQASTSEVIADLVAEIQDLRKRLAAAGI